MQLGMMTLPVNFASSLTPPYPTIVAKRNVFLLLPTAFYKASCAGQVLNTRKEDGGQNFDIVLI